MRLLLSFLAIGLLLLSVQASARDANQPVSLDHSEEEKIKADDEEINISGGESSETKAKINVSPDESNENDQSGLEEDDPIHDNINKIKGQSESENHNTEDDRLGEDSDHSKVQNNNKFNFHKILQDSDDD